MSSTSTSRIDGLSTSVAVKAPVHAVATTNITLSGLQTVGGVVLDGSMLYRVLLPEQTNPVENGIWDASTGSWTRAKDFDGSRDIVKGTLVPKSTGSGGAFYRVTTANPIVIGTSEIEFESVSETGIPSAGLVYEITPAEQAVGVTPVNYFYPPPDMLAGSVSRFGTSSQSIQDAIDGAPDNCIIYFDPTKTYTATKNTSLLPSVYPTRSGNSTGEQPCNAIYQRNGLTIDGQGALITVGVHAQGWLDILQSSRITIRNFRIAGPGAFPGLDGVTGRSEKGTASEGYYDSAATNGPARNNSRNTSNYTAGGYGGAFPQVGGGTAGTWGLWTGGGYIANSGDGIAVDDASNDIIIEDCEIYGFNGDGIHVGSTLNEGYGFGTCGRVTLRNNYLHDNYNAGIEYHNVTYIILDGNKCIDNGHPDATISDEDIDPGYGIASNNGYAPVNVVIEGNICTGNKRKGIDAHSVDTLICTDNICTDSGFGIMLVNGADGSIRNIICNNNIVKRIAYPMTAHGVGIYIERNSSGAAGFYGNAIVSNNEVYEVGVPTGQTSLYTGTSPYGVGIQLSGALTGVVCNGNLIQNTGYIGLIGLCIGYGGTDAILGIAATNSIRGPWKTGILNAASGNTNNSTVGNNVEITDTTPYTAGQTGISGATDRHFCGNNINVPSGDAYCSGCAQNIELIVKVVITSGSISYTTGFNQSHFVSSVASHANGIQINFSSGIAVQNILCMQSSATPAVVTAGSILIDYVYARTLASPAVIGLQAAGTDRAASAVTGSFDFRISI